MTETSDEPLRGGERDLLLKLVDESTCRNVLSRLGPAMDWFDRSMLERIFWPEASIDFGFLKARAAEFIPQLIALQRPSIRPFHLIGCDSITLKGNRAQAESYGIAYGLAPGPHGGHVAHMFYGRYMSELEKRGGEWRIAGCTYLMHGGDEWVPCRPAAVPGPEDRHPLIHMPKGIGKILVNPELTWAFPSEHRQRAMSTSDAWLSGKDVWLRERTLGGSSSVNGMIYSRCHPEDYDEWEHRGAPGWNWATMSRAFRELEDHILGDDGWRGAGGPLHVSVATEHPPLCELAIQAGREMGLPAHAELNTPGQEGVGYFPRTIRKGCRMSAARAFLQPIRRRPNLVIETRAEVSRILFEDRCAAGVQIDGDVPREIRGREIILSAGTIQSAKLLQLSGIGDGGQLSRLGIKPVSDLPGVGSNVREHRPFTLQFRLQDPRLSENSRYSGLKLALEVGRYYLLRAGPLATVSHNLGAFVRTDPSLTRPDAELLIVPYSIAIDSPPRKSAVMQFEQEPGMQVISYALRPESCGSIRIRSADYRELPEIKPDYLSAEYDRRVSIRAFRYVRQFMSMPSLSRHVSAETYPGPGIETEAEILCFVRDQGQPGFHAVGSCAMGSGPEAVVDSQLRVRGVANLRVVDCSVMPTMVSGHTNGPVMALAWHAARLIDPRC